MKIFSLILCAFCLVTLAVMADVPAMAQEANRDASFPGFPSGLSPYGYYSYLFPQLLAEDIMLRKMQIRFLDTFIDPDEYTIGSGDQFSISFTAGDISDLGGEVNSDGTLFIKSVGPIYLGHISLREAIGKITGEIKKSYSKAEFTIRLVAFRTSRVQVVGAVMRPGIYYAPAIWRVSEVINMAGGFVPGASTRGIILRGFGATYPVDIVRFEVFGASLNNPMICGGNVIVVPMKQINRASISISGLVNQPAEFESVAGDSITDILTFAGGAKGNLQDMDVIISSDNGSEISRLDGASLAASDYQLSRGENVRFVWKKGRENYGTVIISGAVERPGRYSISDSLFTLSRLLQLCGGFAPDARPGMIQIFRRALEENNVAEKQEYMLSAIDGRTVGVNLISLDPRGHWETASIAIKDGDSLFAPQATGTVLVEGAVVSPGLVPYQKGKGVDYYLQRTGGVGFDADPSRIVVMNPVTRGQISVTDVRELFDGEVILVPHKERSVKP